MRLVRYSGLFDELEKISEDQRKYVTKEKFKRHLKTLVPTTLGAALGTGAGYALRGAVLRRKGPISEALKRHPKVLKYAPAATAALGTIGGYLGRLKDKKVRDYVEYGNDGPK